MVVGLITGLILGAAVVYLVFLSRMKKKDIEASDSAALLTRANRRVNGEVAGLRLKVQEYEKEQREGRDLIMLFPDLVKQIFSGRDSDEVVSYVNRACQNLLKAGQSAIFLADRTGARLGLATETGLSDVLGQRVNLGLGEGFVGLAAETGRFLAREDLEKESVLVRRNLIMSDIPGFKPDYAAPMHIEGVIYGVITVGGFDSSGAMRKETLRALAAVGAAALENVRIMERFSRLSDLDSDTGFLGKTALEPALTNELERVERFGSCLAVIELEMKSAEADEVAGARDVMTAAGKHLVASLRNIDIGVRTGRGTVILLLPGTDRDGMKSVTGKLGGELPILALDNGSHVGAVGIKSYVVEGGTRLDVRDLLDKLRSQEFMEFEGYYEV